MKLLNSVQIKYFFLTDNFHCIDFAKLTWTCSFKTIISKSGTVFSLTKWLYYMILTLHSWIWVCFYFYRKCQIIFYEQIKTLKKDFIFFVSVFHCWIKIKVLFTYIHWHLDLYQQPKFIYWKKNKNIILLINAVLFLFCYLQKKIPLFISFI